MSSDLSRRRPASAETKTPSPIERMTPSTKEKTTPSTVKERMPSSTLQSQDPQSRVRAKTGDSTQSSSESPRVPEVDWPVPGGKDHPLFGTIYTSCVLATMLFLYAYFSAFASYYDAFLGGKPL